jgi:DNA-binding transcriptional LysR family regulator
MELRQLRTLVMVAETGSVSAAARALHLSQPALSRQIRDLEAELGIALFDRVGRRIVPTIAGQEICERSRSVLDDAASLRERAAALRDGHTGILKAAAPAQFMESFLPKFLGIYCQRFPRVDVRLTQDIAPRLLERLVRGQLHVVIGIDEPADFHRFDWQLLCPVSILALVSRRHKLADRTTLSIAELRDQPMLLLETGMFARTLFDDACITEKVAFTVVLESSGPHSLVALARAGHGIAVIPSTLTFDQRGICVLPLTARGKPLGRWIVAVWNRQRYMPPYGEQFIEQLHTAVQEDYPGRSLGMTQMITRPSLTGLWSGDT